ncbi:glycogen synthase GlgA [Acidaminobacter sp. JC074]|uniref:glycogen synthase GlgA n=1 Tax=Acidaminobacter sp. JC074 TaxID=2530199 RepID=UPI001F10C5A4|nr:glycogen synthase GlgA [Acidaminobacter sp. JC074]MCH4890243.1 glycogen synthase GlgA [Acidaminobacter sp. JC074]
MKVLFVSAEVVPFSKTGGLADVAYSLPRALIKEGVDVRVMTSRNFHNRKVDVEERHLLNTEVEVGWRKQYLGISMTEFNDIPFYFLDNEYYFKREGIYGHFDDAERYSYFCRAALEALIHLDFEPDLIHFNDWHTAMIPLLMKKHYGHIEKFSNIKTVFTIHNLRYQGVYDAQVLNELLNLDYSEFESGAVEFFGGINFMKSGITFADAVTTVSDTYAKEIKEPYFGEKLHDLIRDHEEKLHGIVNGIDFEIYNPEIDPKIVKNYTYKNSSRKQINKEHLQNIMGLKKSKRPLIAMVSRLADQKGLDLLEHIIEELLELDIQLVVLGSGEEKYENMFKHFSYHYENLSASIGFNEELAHEIYAGADMLLMPSLFEPCGLSQLISQRYGTVPIVRETGGLRDTVIHYNKYTQEGSGFSFGSYNAHELLFAVKRALELYDNKKEWRGLVKNIMQLDTSWKQSALKYKALYQDLIGV